MQGITQHQWFKCCAASHTEGFSYFLRRKLGISAQFLQEQVVKTTPGAGGVSCPRNTMGFEPSPNQAGINCNSPEQGVRLSLKYQQVIAVTLSKRRKEPWEWQTNHPPQKFPTLMSHLSPSAWIRNTLLDPRFIRNLNYKFLFILSVKKASGGDSSVVCKLEFIYNLRCVNDNNFLSGM